METILNIFGFISLCVVIKYIFMHIMNNTNISFQKYFINNNYLHIAAFVIIIGILCPLLYFYLPVLWTFFQITGVIFCILKILKLK